MQFPDYETHTVEVTEKNTSTVADYETNILQKPSNRDIELQTLRHTKLTPLLWNGIRITVLVLILLLI